VVHTLAIVLAALGITPGANDAAHSTTVFYGRRPQTKRACA
jgi:hypothetical protein